MSRVLVMMSGGVDSSVAAALLLADGHDVVGATLKLWDGAVGEGAEAGCCSVADVEDARRVAASLDIPHYVFNFTEEFTREVIDPFAAAYASGRTPNPCIDCNRTMKFGRLLARARRLGFDHVATGHHARVARAGDRYTLLRGVDRAKDQSYVLYPLGQAELARTLLPIGGYTKREIRDVAARLGLRTAAKAESMDVCFVSRSERAEFVARRTGSGSGPVVDREGRVVGHHRGVGAFTIGQRRGLGVAAGGRRYVVDIDPKTRAVTVGERRDLLRDRVLVTDVVWTHAPRAAGAAVEVQLSAHGASLPARIDHTESYGADSVDGALVARLGEERPRVAPGQAVVFYEGEAVVGGGRAA